MMGVHRGGASSFCSRVEVENMGGISKEIYYLKAHCQTVSDLLLVVR